MNKLQLFSASLFAFVLLTLLSSAQTESLLRFENGQSQPVEAFGTAESWLKQQLWVESTFDSDGDGQLDRIHIYLTRPAITDSLPIRLPVILSASPYYGLSIWALLGFTDGRLNWKVKHELGAAPRKKRPHPRRKTRTKYPLFASSMDQTWIPRGYVMVYASSPGTGLSDGAPTVGGENESLGPKAVIDWLCGRAKAYDKRTGGNEVKAFWSSGKVGMTGTSYDGTLCIAAATTGVEGLEAIIPVAPVTSFYNYYRSNGLVRSPGGYLGEDMDVLYDLINTGDKKKRKRNNAKVRDDLLAKEQDRKTGDFNTFWASRDYVSKIGSMKCAMLMAHGFNDWNVMPEHSFRFYEAAKEQGLPVQLFYHQAGHGGDPPLEMMNRWFTRYLHGIENGVENDPPVRIVREGEKKSTTYTAYPDPAAQAVTFYLHADAGLRIAPPVAPQGPLSFTDNARKDYLDLLEDKNAKHRLLFTTEPLGSDLRISGTTTVKLRLAASKSAANLSVYLVALPITEGKEVPIYDHLITRGWADPQNHSSLETSSALVPGTFYELNFALNPDDQVIPKGKRLGLLVFSSDKEFTIQPKAGTVLTVDLNGSSITIPMVGGYPMNK